MKSDRHAWWRARVARTAVIAVILGGVLAACSTAGQGGAGDPRSGRLITVVAAENFWGSVAGQLGGSHVQLTSVITNPNTDPHDYEPTAADARSVAEAQLLIVNGVGYDQWASELAAGEPVSGRITLNVGELAGIKAGGNPHRWYYRPDVYRVIAQITADYRKLDPADAAYFTAREHDLEDSALAPYNALISRIRRTYAGTPIAASESIATPLARTLGLTMATPESFLDAISEGSEPTAADSATALRLITSHRVKVYVLNSQNVTPDVEAQVRAARAARIPVTTITETLTPANDSFEQWQVSQLRRLDQALAAATGH